MALPYGSDPLTLSGTRGARLGEGSRDHLRFALPRRRSIWDGVGSGALSGLGGLDREAGGRARRSESHRLRGPQPARRPRYTGGHERRRSLATVRKYIRDGTLFRDNAATKLGL